MNPFQVSLCIFTLSLAACGSEVVADRASLPPSPEVAKVALSTDPGDALSVTAAKQKGATKMVVVEGRVRDITKGFAVMKLMDASLEYCGEVNKEDQCKTPWDYCCESSDTQLANSLLVEVRGADGQPLATPSLPATRLLDRVKVRGELRKTEHGNWVLVANGLFQVERPGIPDYVKWPE